MSRRGQRSRYRNDAEDDDQDDGWERTSAQKRANGDYASSLSASSMTRELDDLMRIIEADWNIVTTTNVCPELCILNNVCSQFGSTLLWKRPCSSWIEARSDAITMLSKPCIAELNVHYNSLLMVRTLTYKSELVPY